MADCGEAAVAGAAVALVADSAALPLVPLEADNLLAGSCICFPVGNINRRSPSHDGITFSVEAGGLVLVGMTVGGVSFSVGTYPLLPWCTSFPVGNMKRRSCQDEEDMVVPVNLSRTYLMMR